MSSPGNDFREDLWETAKELVWLDMASPIDRPSQFWIDKMIEEKYQELLESSHE